MSQEQFAQHIGVTNMATVSRWESSERTPQAVHMSRIIELEEELGIKAAVITTSTIGMKRIREVRASCAAVISLYEGGMTEEAIMLLERLIKRMKEN